MVSKPKISLAIPVHNMKNKDFFLKRLLKSVHAQSFQDFEIVITENGSMAKNTNEAIKQSKGDLIKILYMDDYLSSKHSLQRIVEAFKGQWLATGCNHDDGKTIGSPHYAFYNEQIHKGNNTIGSPSVVTIKNGLGVYFDEHMTWLLDCDFYKRMYEKFGEPTILDDINVTIGIGEHQVTNILSGNQKRAEHSYLQRKYK